MMGADHVPASSVTAPRLPSKCPYMPRRDSLRAHFSFLAFSLSRKYALDSPEVCTGRVYSPILDDHALNDGNLSSPGKAVYLLGGLRR
jgi:hypothetical protein